MTENSLTSPPAQKNRSPTAASSTPRTEVSALIRASVATSSRSVALLSAFAGGLFRVRVMTPVSSSVISSNSAHLLGRGGLGVETDVALQLEDLEEDSAERPGVDPVHQNADGDVPRCPASAHLGGLVEDPLHAGLAPVLHDPGQVVHSDGDRVHARSALLDERGDRPLSLPGLDQ